MAKKGIDLTNLDNLTDPLMDKTLGALVGSPAKKTTAKNSPQSKKTSDRQKQPTPQEASHSIVADTPETESPPPSKYSYHTEKREVEGVGVVEKVISKKGNVIGRPNVPTKVKKKPITLTLTPELYDLVKERAASDHRTTSEYLAMIIEEHLRE